ncbi:MAG: hypothetical protein ABIH23_13235 [bacterium]
MSTLKIESFVPILEEMIEQQRVKLLSIAREYDPGLTLEDLLSPHDIPVLCRDTRFGFEDGILAGLLSARAALLAVSRR